MTQDLSERQQNAAERFLEDESLTEDLTDAPARMLITWASEQASALAGDKDRSDEQLAVALKALRTAVRAAAASGETDGSALVAQAQTALDTALGNPPSAVSASAQPRVPPERDAAKVTQPTTVANNPTSSPPAKHNVPSQKRQQQSHNERHYTKQPRTDEPNDRHNQHTDGEKHDTQPTPHSWLRVPDPPITRAAESPQRNDDQSLSRDERMAHWLENIAQDEQE